MANSNTLHLTLVHMGQIKINCKKEKETSKC